MPSNLLTADTSFPQLNNQQSTDEKFTVVTNYLYMLLEQLRYTLANLGIDNFNETELGEIANIITEPVYIQLQSDEGDIAALYVTAQALTSRVSDAEGNVSALQQTSTALASRIQDAEGNISSLVQTASVLDSRLSDAEGDISALTQTATSLTSRISSAEGNISTLTQTATSLTSRISSAEGNISILQQTVNGFGLSVSNGSSSSTLYLTSNGVKIASANISFSGVVTFTDLSTAGATTIYGGNIDTTTLKVSNLYGQYVYLRNSAGTAIGRLSITGADSSAYAVDLTSYGALRLTASSGDLYMASASCSIGLSGNAISVGCSYLYPAGTAAYLGYTGKGMWQAVYSYTAAIQTSDRNLKHDIEDLDERYLQFILWLTPKRFKMNNGTSNRYHIGFIAQDVYEGMELFGISDLEFAGWVKDVDADGNEILMLRYEEFIGLVQLGLLNHEKRISVLEGKV